MSDISQSFEMVEFTYNSFVQICQIEAYVELWIA